MIYRGPRKPERDAELIRLHMLGADEPTLAQMFAISQPRVSQILHNHGVAPRQRAAAFLQPTYDINPPRFRRYAQTPA